MATVPRVEMCGNPFAPGSGADSKGYHRGVHEIPTDWRASGSDGILTIQGEVGDKGEL